MGARNKAHLGKKRCYDDGNDMIETGTNREKDRPTYEMERNAHVQQCRPYLSLHDDAAISKLLQTSYTHPIRYI